MSALDLSISSDLTLLQVGVPWDLSRKFVITVPQFYGATPYGGRIVLNQVLQWHIPDTPGVEAAFSLDIPPEEATIDFTGKLSIPREDELLLRLRLKNCGANPVHEGHHTGLISFPAGDEMIDTDGFQTFFHADIGWIPLEKLCERVAMASIHHPIRCGANFSGVTVIWNMIARVFPKEGYVVGVGVERSCGYAFASDHPDWGPGLLAGLRWGTSLNPNDCRETWLRFYFLKGNLDTLHQRFSTDRREH